MLVFYLNKIQFINEKIGYVIGGDPEGSYLLKTINAGQTRSATNLNSIENGYQNKRLAKNQNKSLKYI